MSAKIIFVLSDGRTGSTLLCQLLGQYQQMTNLSESLHQLGRELLTSDENFSNHLREKFNNYTLSDEEFQFELLKDPKAVISEISSYFDNTVILKIHLTQLDILEHLHWILSQPNHKFILLERNNFLGQYTSLKIAEQTNEWHRSNTTDIKINIDPRDFEFELSRYYSKYDHIKRELKKHNVDYLKLEYDKDLKNYDVDEFNNLIYPWFAKDNIDLKFDPSKEKVNVSRQNSNDDFFNNVINREEILDLIKAKNLNINLG